MTSIYGATVTRDNAVEWLRNNPRASQDRALLAVADFNANGGVDAAELSRACTAGTVVLDGVHHMSFVDSEAPAPRPMPRQGGVRGDVRKDNGDACVMKMIGAFFGGLALIAYGGKIKSTPMTLAGIGVLFGGVAWAACSKKD